MNFRLSITTAISFILMFGAAHAGSSHDSYYADVLLSGQSAFNFVKPLPSRILVNDKIDLSFFVNQSVVFQYRIKIEVPAGAESSVTKSLLNWSPWVNNDINNLIIPKAVKAGRYKLLVEFKIHNSSEIRKFSKSFDVETNTTDIKRPIVANELNAKPELKNNESTNNYRDTVTAGETNNNLQSVTKNNSGSLTQSESDTTIKERNEAINNALDLKPTFKTLVPQSELPETDKSNPDLIHKSDKNEISKYEPLPTENNEVKNTKQTDKLYSDKGNDIKKFYLSMGTGSLYGAPLSGGVSLGINAILFKHIYVSYGRISENGDLFNFSGVGAGLLILIMSENNNKGNGYISLGYGSIATYNFSGGTVTNPNYLSGISMGGVGESGVIYGFDFQIGYRLVINHGLFISASVGYATGKDDDAKKSLATLKSLTGTTFLGTTNPPKIIREPTYNGISYSFGIGWSF